MGKQGLRERKKQRTEREIAEAALELCCARGFNAATVEEIADAAEVSASTFFRYFGSKEAAVLGYRVRGLTDSFWPALEEARSLNEVLAVVEELALVDARGLDTEPRGKDRIRLIHNTPSLSGLQLQAEGMVEEAIGRRLVELHGGDDILLGHLIAGAVMGPLRAARGVWLEDRSGRSAESYVKEAFTVLRRHLPRTIAGDDNRSK